MSNWSFLTNHGRALLCIARDPEVRLRDIAADLGITERHAYAIVTDLAEAGYIVKVKEGRRNRYEVQAHLVVPGLADREQAIGEVLDILAGRARARTQKRRGAPRPDRRGEAGLVARDRSECPSGVAWPLRSVQAFGDLVAGLLVDAPPVPECALRTGPDTPWRRCPTTLETKRSGWASSITSRTRVPGWLQSSSSWRSV